LPSTNLSLRPHVEQGFTSLHNFHQAYSRCGTGENALLRGRKLQGLAALLDVQKNLWECPPRGSQLKLADLQECEKAPLLQAKGNAGRLLKMSRSQRCCALIIFQPTILLQSPAPQHDRAVCRIIRDQDSYHASHWLFNPARCQEWPTVGITYRQGIAFPPASRRDVLLGTRRAIWQMQRLASDENAPKVTTWILTG